MKTIVEALVSKNDERILRSIDDDDLSISIKNLSRCASPVKPIETPFSR
jgi:hypothetical protein